MKIETILVATDLTVQGSAAVQLAWQLALAHGGSLQMAYMPAPGRDVPDLLAQARGADLVVVPCQHDRSPAGSAGRGVVGRLLREARCPVLVTCTAHDEDLPGAAPAADRLLAIR